MRKPQSALLRSAKIKQRRKGKKEILKRQNMEKEEVKVLGLFEGWDVDDVPAPIEDPSSCPCDQQFKKVLENQDNLEKLVQRILGKRTHRDLWDEHDLAEFFKCSVQKVRRARQQGDGPPIVRVGRNIRYRPADVRRHVLNLRCKSNSDGDVRLSKKQK